MIESLANGAIAIAVPESSSLKVPIRQRGCPIVLHPIEANVSARKNPINWENDPLRRGSGSSLAIDPGLKNVALETLRGYDFRFLIRSESRCAPAPSLLNERTWLSEAIEGLDLGFESFVVGSLPNLFSNPFWTALALSRLIVVIH